MERNLQKKYLTTNDIILEPNDILRTKSEVVTIPLNREDREILKKLYNHVVSSQDEDYAIRYNIRSAVGIAAIQIGIPKRLLAIKTIDEDKQTHKYMLANPVYTYQSEEICYLSNGEGCLSVEEGKYKGIVPRHHHIVVEGYNLHTNKVEKIDVSGYVAIVLQHEMDHLDGILYIDRINKLNPFLIKDEWIVI